MGKLSKALRKSILLVAALALPLALAPSVDARPLEEIISSKKIKLGYLIYPPFEMKDPKTGKVAGLWVEALEKVFGEINIEVEWVETGWGTFAAALQSGQFDVFIGGSFATPQRSLALNFTQPFSYMGNTVVIRKEDVGRFKTLGDLDQPGVRVVSPLGSAPHDWLKQHFKEAKVSGTDSPNQSAPSLEVMSRHADAAFIDAFIAAGDVANNPDQLHDLFGSDPINVLPISWAIKKGEPELLAFLNNLITFMDVNGVWRDLGQAYRDDIGGLFYAKRNYVPAGGPASQPMIK